MFSKSVLAAAALASTLALGTAGSAKADPYVSLGIGFGGPGPVGYVGAGYGGGYYGGGGYPYPYHHPRPWGYAGGYGYDGGYGYPHGPGYGGFSCGAGADVARARGFRGVQPVDCSAPVYGYRGWKHGQPFDIRVSMRGNVVGVSPSYW